MIWTPPPDLTLCVIFLSSLCYIGDDMAISIVSRGGPEKYQVTGWLQVDEASKHHEGYYICVAHNKLGSDKKTGRIKIHEKSEYQNRSPSKNTLIVMENTSICKL